MKMTVFARQSLQAAVVAVLLHSASIYAQQDDPHIMHANDTSSFSDAPHNNHSASHGAEGSPGDARDPHAYANDYTLTTGPYSMPDSRHLKHANEHRFWSVLGDRIEYDPDNKVTSFDLLGWYGTTYDRLVIKLEGDIVDGDLEESQADLLWSHAVNALFDSLAGIRLDNYHEGQDRQWLALGIQGLAPYWLEVDLTGYLGESGRTALSLEVEYELFLTQYLILQPRAELSAYGKNDYVNGLGSGLSDATIGLRLRYEYFRQFAPFVGVEWNARFGNTADQAKANGQTTRETRYFAGISFWF